MAVAAVFVRASYEIRWLTETDRKLPEFIASHPSSKVEIAVEAKCRHRPGVLGRDGDLPDVDDLRVDVDGLMKRALEKETDGRPYIVCLDLNLPPEQGEDIEAWSAELQRKVLAPSAARPPASRTGSPPSSSRTTPGTGTAKKSPPATR